MEYKAGPQFTKEINDRTVIGIPVVHGNIDDSGDRSHPGSFADIAAGGRNRTRFLWQHNGQEPPIAKINYVREIPRSELPKQVLEFAPDATGGVEISRTYLKSQRASDVLEGLQEGAIEEMSYAYDIIRKGSTEIEGQTIRELYGIKTFDFSDVNWGLNNATSAIKALSWSGAALTFVEHSDAVVTAIEEYTQRVKDRRDFRQSEGRDLSAANRERIIALAEGLKAVMLDLETLLNEMARRGQEAQPKADNASQARALFIEYQRIAAQLNGVNYAN